MNFKEIMHQDDVTNWYDVFLFIFYHIFWNLLSFDELYILLTDLLQA